MQFESEASTREISKPCRQIQWLVADFTEVEVMRSHSFERGNVEYRL